MTPRQEGYTTGCNEGAQMTNQEIVSAISRNADITARQVENDEFLGDGEAAMDVAHSLGYIAGLAQQIRLV
jgi:hypothetical protein